jgi:hydroxypyruvate isomerase
MFKLCAHLGTMFNEVSFLDRFQRAAQIGFKGVEYLPYEWDKEILREKLDKYGLIQVLHNLPMGNLNGGDRGFATIPGRVAEFQQGVGTALEYAKALKCSQLCCIVGYVPQGVYTDLVYKTVVENFRFAARELDKRGIRFLTEPLNLRDYPGFFLHSTKDALQLIKDVNHKNLWIQYDIYHAQTAEGDLSRNIAENIGHIGHFHVSDCPGRGEPGTGEINYDNLLKSIEKTGYSDWVGCEYKPTIETERSLAWAKKYLDRRGI